MIDKPETKDAPVAEAPILDDATFAQLDTDNDGVVHLLEEQMRGNYTPPAAPVEPEQKSLGSAPENKDAGPAPVGADLAPGRRKGR